MKRAILLSSLFLLLLACGKDETYCWRCENYSYLSSRVISTATYCDKTVEEIVKIEDDLSMPGIFDYSCTRK